MKETNSDIRSQPGIKSMWTPDVSRDRSESQKWSSLYSLKWAPLPKGELTLENKASSIFGARGSLAGVLHIMAFCVPGWN